MKNLFKLLVAVVIVVLFGSAAQAQKYSLFYTRTLHDGFQNPHHKSLDSCRAFASNLFFVVPTFGLDFTVNGQLNDVIKSLLASENLTRLALSNGGDNTINNRVDLNLLMMKFRLSRKREAELGIYAQLKTEVGINVNNGLFNLLTQGNTPFLGQSIDGFIDLGGLANVYAEAGLTYRQKIYGKLSGGFKVGYVMGIANTTFDIKDSKFTTSANGDTINIQVNGEIRSPVSLFQKQADGTFELKPAFNTNDLIADMMKNTGYAFSAGLQYDLTPKATLSAGLLNFGVINWNENSRIYTIKKNATYAGVPVLEGQDFVDSILKDFQSYDIDSTIGAYSSPLLGRVEVSGQYRWANWFHQTVVVSKPLYQNSLEFALVNNLRLAKRFNFIVLGTHTTAGFNAIGAQFLYRAKGGGLDLYFGSEKAFNTYDVALQLQDNTRKSAFGIGADFNFGINMAFGRCPKKKEPVQALPSDSDGDGVLDIIDDCVYEYGPIENKGCAWPDTDKDGIFDKDDSCITIVGPKENNGCPWPDADNDSVPDKDDKCPTSFGLAEHLGCPDSDTDGVYDNYDSCLTVKGPKDNNGCPFTDLDGDGVPDKYDRCPNVPGPADSAGCPGIPQKVVLTAAEQEVINKVFSNLTFVSGKAVIEESSYPALEGLLTLLKDKPYFKLAIDGHTDNSGNATANKKLSRQRADAVADYLTKNGISDDRIYTKGYGSERPIADNATEEGRTQNRRVEFTILE